ncbi:hypothetical protein FAM18119_02109 [Lacticaseibacillus paracasei]|nr:hypothetical protein FAM18119_02109 [Lacticaseibacillus paracasei]
MTDIARALNMQVGDFFIAPEMSDISTLAMVKYLTHLPEKERARVSEVLMQVINL